MVNWKEVERLRAKGWDWPSIAEEKKVEFTAPEGVEDSGRALKALYLSRKSKKSRSSRGDAIDSEDGGEAESPSVPRNRKLFWAGLIIGLLGGVWGAIALLLPAPFGIYVSAFPDLFAVLVIGLALLIFVFVSGLPDVRGIWWKPVTIGIVLALVAAGLSGFVAYESGYASLSPPVTINGEWSYASNQAWTSGGKPVVFFMGSEACPYCSASSWALRVALQALGTLTGYGTSTSSPTDTFANTPETTLATSSLSSSYLSWDPVEGQDNQQITIPALDHTQTSYQLAYDSGGSIPFVVVDGIYVSVGTIINPQLFCINQQASTNSEGETECTEGTYSPQNVTTAVTTESGPLWFGANGITGIETAAIMLEAYFAKAYELQNHNNPPAALQNSANWNQIETDIAEIPSP
jgi:Domain of unknown function (DUF929)